jgi:hypothetical protein
MNTRNNRRVVKRPAKDQGKTRAAKTRERGTKWEVADEQLDEALRQTFPASDALSIIQTVRGR